MTYENKIDFLLICDERFISNKSADNLICRQCTIQCDHFSQNISYTLGLYIYFRIVSRSTMQKMTTDEIGCKEGKNKDNNNKNNKTRKLKPIVLSPNVNDYDTGENNLT